MIVKVSGFQVSPVEVEQTIAAASGVADCGVFAVPDERRGRSVIAVVVVDPATHRGSSAELEASLRDWAHERLASLGKRPTSYLFVDDLPFAEREASAPTTSRRVRDSPHLDRLSHMSAPAAAVNPPTQRDKNRARTRRDIETAALELFEAKGYQETTVEEIARTAGCSSATFFRHFGSRRTSSSRTGRSRTARWPGSPPTAPTAPSSWGPRPTGLPVRPELP